MPRLTRRDFERLLEFRVTLRRFQRWSEDQARAAGLTQVQARDHGMRRGGQRPGRQSQDLRSGQHADRRGAPS